jgi:hypothetical protein
MPQPCLLQLTADICLSILIDLKAKIVLILLDIKDFCLIQWSGKVSRWLR